MALRRWTQDEDDFLWKHYLTRGARWCSITLKRSYNSVAARAVRLGIRDAPPPP